MMKMLSRRLQYCCCLGAGIIGASLSCGAGELTLAENGKTVYRVVKKHNADQFEAAAAADLAQTLKEITGADFGPGKDKTRFIHIGVVPPCDTKPLEHNERRITTYHGDIYLYGKGYRANVNAVYDFLRDELGCHWYTVSGDKKIPKRDKIVLPELKKSLTPAIPFMTASNVARFAPWADFSRRIGLCDRTDNCIGSSDTHAGQRIIPSGLIPFGGRIGNTFGPLKYFVDRKYFKTHPEYFALDRHGKRVVTMQLCYSNPGMRDEYVRNILYMLEKENYQGGQIIVGVGQDDNGGKFCCCPECEALEKKYDHPAGAYYDFLLDISARFAKTHPDVLLSFLAYRADQTLSPSKLMTKLPPNLLPSYAPLGADFSKPLNHPVNARQAENFKRWSAIAARMHWWAYPTPYPRPIVSFPMIANIHRIAENFRTAHANKVWMAYCEFGYGPYSRFGFNDLRLYLLSELCRRIDADEQAIIKDFTDGCYGPAAPKVREFLAELEKLEVEYPYFLRWNPDILGIAYATGENLLRWQRDFGEMEKLAGNDERILGNLRRLRYFLDQQTIAAWPYLTTEQQKAFGGLEEVIARAEKTIVDDTEALHAPIRKISVERFKAANRGRIAYLHSGLDQYIHRARGGKALPEAFKGHQTYRILPNRNKKGLDMDPEAPFGLCNTGVCPKSGNWFIRRSHDNTRTPNWQNEQVPKPVTGSRLERAGGLDGKYHYYYLGAMPVEQDMQVAFGRISPISGFAVGHLFDPARPKRLFDFYVCIAADPNKKWVKIGELVVVPRDDDAVDGRGKRKPIVNDTVDAFI